MAITMQMNLRTPQQLANSARRSSSLQPAAPRSPLPLRSRMVVRAEEEGQTATETPGPAPTPQQKSSWEVRMHAS